MNLLTFLLLLVALAALLQVARFWARAAFVVVLAGGLALVWIMLNLSTSSLDLMGATLALDPSTRAYLAAALGLTTLLALATTFGRDRTSLPMLYWCWPAWVVALAVNDLVVSVFAWALGFIVLVLGMKPRKYQRTSGAAYYLVVIVLGTAGILLAGRFIALYPLTPERTELIEAAVLFLAWGMGLFLAVFPFHLWIGPMTDDTPLPVAAAVLALGQPVGLWLLVRLLSQYPWLLDKGNLLQLITLGGAAAILTGGFMAGVERRAGRLLGYAAILSMGFILMDLGKASQEALDNAGLELVFRAFGLTAMAASITVGRGVKSETVRRTALVAFLLSALGLVGLRLGVSLAGRWSLLAEWAATDQRLLFLVLLADTGLLVGVLRYARSWFAEGRPVDQPAAAQRAGQPAAAALAAATAPAAIPALENAGAHADGGNGRAQPAPAILEPALIEENGGRESGEFENGEEESPVVDAVQKERSPDEYVFEEHVREIAADLAAQWGPRLSRVARSLPGHTRSSLVRSWQSWPIWAGFGLLVVLIALVVLAGLEPAWLYNYVGAVFGILPFAQ